MRKGRFSRSLSLCQTCACRSHSSTHLDSFVHCHDVVKVESDLYLCDGFAHVKYLFLTRDGGCQLPERRVRFTISHASQPRGVPHSRKVETQPEENYSAESDQLEHLRWILDLSPSFCCRRYFYFCLHHPTLPPSDPHHLAVPATLLLCTIYDRIRHIAYRHIISISILSISLSTGRTSRAPSLPFAWPKITKQRGKQHSPKPTCTHTQTHQTTPTRSTPHSP